MDPLADLVGESATFDAVRAQIRRLLARRDKGRRLPSILLTGETSSGSRERRARAKVWSPAPSIARVPARAGRSSTSTARRFQTTCSRPSSSASSAGPHRRAPIKGRPVLVFLPPHAI